MGLKRKRWIASWVTHAQPPPLPSSLCLYVSKMKIIWQLWSPFFQAGLSSHSRDSICTLRSGSVKPELRREQKSSTV